MKAEAVTDLEASAQRLRRILQFIMDEKSLSQAKLGEQYLDVSQSCIRDYLSGKVVYKNIKVSTMQSIARLYGVSLDSLTYYLEYGTWKRNLSYEEMEANIRGIGDLRVLLNLHQLSLRLITEKIERLPGLEIETERARHPNEHLIALIEQEKAKIPNEQRWLSIIKGYDISDAELVSIYTGEQPRFELLVRLANLLHYDLEDLIKLYQSEQRESSATMEDSPTVESNSKANYPGSPFCS